MITAASGKRLYHDEYDMPPRALRSQMTATTLKRYAGLLFLIAANLIWSGSFPAPQAQGMQQGIPCWCWPSSATRCTMYTPNISASGSLPRRPPAQRYGEDFLAHCPSGCARNDGRLRTMDACHENCTRVSVAALTVSAAAPILRAAWGAFRIR